MLRRNVRAELSCADFVAPKCPGPFSVGCVEVEGKHRTSFRESAVLDEIIQWIKRATWVSESWPDHAIVVRLTLPARLTN